MFTYELYTLHTCFNIPSRKMGILTFQFVYTKKKKKYTANPLCKLCKKLCKAVYYMNHTTQLCGSYSTQLYTTLHNGFAV